MLYNRNSLRSSPILYFLMLDILNLCQGKKFFIKMQKNPDQQKIKLMQSTTLISVPLEAFLVTMDNCQDMTSLLLFEHFLAHADNHEIESNITRKTGLKCGR